MGLPTIPDINPKIDIQREDVINLFLTSIAMEELSLSHLIDAEAKKVQYVLGTLDGQSQVNPSIDDLIKVNDSVDKLLDKVTKTQMLLHAKLRDILTLVEPISPKNTLSGRGAFNVSGKNFHELDALTPVLKYTFHSPINDDADPKMTYMLTADSSVLTCQCVGQIAHFKGSGDITIDEEAGSRTISGTLSLNVTDLGIGNDTFRILFNSNEGGFGFDSGLVAINEGDLIVKGV